jgi:hypothetical protein
LAGKRGITTHQTSAIRTKATEETTMNQRIALSALALILVLGGSSGVLAAGKKHAGHEAFASAASATVPDPRVNKGGNHESWCDVDPQCNGWNEWLADVRAGKKIQSK